MKEPAIQKLFLRRRKDGTVDIGIRNEKGERAYRLFSITKEGIYRSAALPESLGYKLNKKGQIFDNKAPDDIVKVHGVMEQVIKLLEASKLAVVLNGSDLKG